MLWIVTQDEKSLMNVKEVTVDGKKIEGIIGTAAFDHWSKILGKYESKERALEVVSEIFTRIEESNGSLITYKMPEK